MTVEIIKETLMSSSKPSARNITLRYLLFNAINLSLLIKFNFIGFTTASIHTLILKVYLSLKKNSCYGD